MEHYPQRSYLVSRSGKIRKEEISEAYYDLSSQRKKATQRVGSLQFSAHIKAESEMKKDDHLSKETELRTNCGSILSTSKPSISLKPASDLLATSSQ